MRTSRLLAMSLLPLAALPCLAHTRLHHTSTSTRGSSRRSAHIVSKSTGQHSIDDSRAAEIQQALVGAGYLSEAPTGHWDATTQSAMQRFQADHGWQTKLIPDSRAIIKLGLGPHSGEAPTTVSSLQ